MNNFFLFVLSFTNALDENAFPTSYKWGGAIKDIFKIYNKTYFIIILYNLYIIILKYIKYIKDILHDPGVRHQFIMGMMHPHNHHVMSFSTFFSHFLVHTNN